MMIPLSDLWSALQHLKVKAGFLPASPSNIFLFNQVHKTFDKSSVFMRLASQEAASSKMNGTHSFQDSFYSENLQ